jgi:type I restriction enzyme S subunit
MWPMKRLGDNSRKIGSGATPRGGGNVYEASGMALIRSQNVYNHGFELAGLAYIGDIHAAELRNVALERGDVLLNITGDSVARCCLVPDEVLPARVNQHVAIVRPNAAHIDARYLRYWLVSPQTQDQLLALASAGATRNALTKRMIEDLQVPTPPLSEQRAIAGVLGALDDKIDLNRQMNETLEAVARAIFKSWFVDFDPVRAKLDGRQPFGMDAATATLFPDAFEDSAVGDVPKGWRLESMSVHFEATKGVSYKGSGLSESGIPLHNLNSVLEGGGYKYDGIKYYNGEYAERHIVCPGDAIVANTEQGHHRLLIGYAAIVPASFGPQGIASHHIYRLHVRDGSPLTSSFIVYLLNTPTMHDLVSGFANGTTVNMLPRDGVQKPLVVVPPRELISAFDEIASLARARREQTLSESRTLAALRDTLLPKLLSGEVRINDRG